MATIHTNYGACMVSRNIYEGKGNLKWCTREVSKRDIDNGWRFLSDIDTADYLADTNNWCILAFETVAEIEPALFAIYNMPVGTDLTLMQDGTRKYFVDRKSGEPIEPAY